MCWGACEAIERWLVRFIIIFRSSFCPFFFHPPFFLFPSLSHLPSLPPLQPIHRVRVESSPYGAQRWCTYGGTPVADSSSLSRPSPPFSLPLNQLAPRYCDRCFYKDGITVPLLPNLFGDRYLCGSCQASPDDPRQEGLCVECFYSGEGMKINFRDCIFHNPSSIAAAVATTDADDLFASIFDDDAMCTSRSCRSIGDDKQKAKGEQQYEKW